MTIHFGIRVFLVLVTAALSVAHAAIISGRFGRREGPATTAARRVAYAVIALVALVVIAECVTLPHGASPSHGFWHRLGALALVDFAASALVPILSGTEPHPAGAPPHGAPAPALVPAAAGGVAVPLAPGARGGVAPPLAPGGAADPRPPRRRRSLWVTVPAVIIGLWALFAIGRVALTGNLSGFSDPSHPTPPAQPSQARLAGLNELQRFCLVKFGMTRQEADVIMRGDGHHAHPFFAYGEPARSYPFRRSTLEIVYERDGIVTSFLGEFVPQRRGCHR